MPSHTVTTAVAVAVAFAAFTPSGATARPIDPAAAPVTAHTEGAPTPVQDLRALAKTSSLAGTTSIRPDMASTRATAPRLAAQVRQDLRSADTRDAAEGRGAFNSPQVVVVKAPPPQQPAIVDGIDWADAGIGAGSLLGLGLITLAGTLAITHRRRAAHDAHAARL
jgi:hypothetical protein